MEENDKNQQAYELFIKNNPNAGTLEKKYVAFVNGKLEEFGDSERELFIKIYDKYGDIDMWLGRTSGEKDVCVIDSVYKDYI